MQKQQQREKEELEEVQRLIRAMRETDDGVGADHAHNSRMNAFNSASSDTQYSNLKPHSDISSTTQEGIVSGNQVCDSENVLTSAAPPATGIQESGKQRDVQSGDQDSVYEVEFEYEEVEIDNGSLAELQYDEMFEGLDITQMGTVSLSSMRRHRNAADAAGASGESGWSSSSSYPASSASLSVRDPRTNTILRLRRLPTSSEKVPLSVRRADGCILSLKPLPPSLQSVASKANSQASEKAARAKDNHTLKGDAW